MKTLLRFSIGVLLLGLINLPAQSFTSLYVFGDALSTTTNNIIGSGANPQWYYGKRYSNGRVWVEVLAQRQGIPIANNWSYYNDNSSNLVVNISKFTLPIPPTALVVVWCNCSDLFDDAYNGVTSQSQWTTDIQSDQANELNAISQLYAKGARTLIMPTPVDVTQVPLFDAELNYTASYLNLIHQESIAYNVAFANTLKQARAAFPGLTIYEPDFFDLLNNVIANASSYGLTNALKNGENYDATDALGKAARTNGLGDNYVYWDNMNPTAKFHEVIADTVQQLISPAQIASISVLGSPSGNTTNVLTVANMPMGLSGFLEGTTNMGLVYGNWTPVANFNAVSPIQSITIIAPPLPPVQEPGGTGSISFGNTGSGSPSGSGTTTSSANSGPPGVTQCYRLRIPFTWVWP
jgi:phospholipase/lecithinase/hemolysin